MSGALNFILSKACIVPTAAAAMLAPETIAAIWRKVEAAMQAEAEPV